MSILTIFMKQRTYLITFMKQRTYLITLPDRPPHQRNSRKTKRSLFCATPLPSWDLIRLDWDSELRVVIDPQCVGEIVICVHEAQHAARTIAQLQPIVCKILS